MADWTTRSLDELIAALRAGGYDVPLGLAEARRVGDDRRDAAGELARADPLVVRQVDKRVRGMGHVSSESPMLRKRQAVSCHVIVPAADRLSVFLRPGLFLPESG